MSRQIDGLSQFAKAWYECDDELSDIQKFNGRLIYHIGNDALNKGFDYFPEKITDFASKTVVVRVNEAVFGALGAGAGTFVGGPLGGIVGGIAGAAIGSEFGEFQYKHYVKPYLDEHLWGKQESVKKQYMSVMRSGGKFVGKVLHDISLSTEEKIDRLSLYSEAFDHNVEQLSQNHPLVANACLDLKIATDAHIKQLQETLGTTERPEEGKEKVSSSISTLKPSKKGALEGQKMLQRYGIDFGALDPKDQFLVAEGAKYYGEWRPKITKEDAFVFAEDIFGILGFSGNSSLKFVSRAGPRTVKVIKEAIALPGLLRDAPHFLAAFHPIAGLAMSVLSLTGLFRKNGPDPLEVVSKRLDKLSEELRAMHQDLLEGINFLAELDRRHFSALMERIDRLEELIIQERSAILTPILINLERAEQRLVLLHQLFSIQMHFLHLTGFEELIYEIDETIQADSTEPEDLAEALLYLKLQKLKKLEHWVEKKAASPHLNGHYFIGLVKDSPVANAEALVMNILMHGGAREQIPFFIAYLAKTAQNVIGKDIFAEVDLETLPNPTIWARGIDTYIGLRQKFIDFQIKYDSGGRQLKKLKTLGSNYLEFIRILKSNQSLLFRNLLNAHSGHLSDLRRVAVTQYAETMLDRLNLIAREHVKLQTAFSYDEGYLRKNVKPNDLLEDILEQFEAYRGFIQEEIVQMETRWANNLHLLIRKLIDSESIEALYECFDRPSCPFARHKQGTKKEESSLETCTGPIFIHIEENGFSIPFSLRALFDNDEALRQSIPKTFYLAEALGLGQFEITVVSQYVNKNHLFTDKEHAVLNKGGFYNHHYRFELSFSFPGKKVTLCLFDCHADQIPVTADVLKAADLSGKMKSRAKAVDSGKHGNTAYWLLGDLMRKNCIFNQVKHLHRTNHLNLVNIEEAARVESELEKQILVLFKQLKLGYHKHFVEPKTASILSDKFENLDISRNIILAFMHLLGYRGTEIEEIQPLLSSTSLKYQMSLHLETEGFGDALSEVNDEASQKLLEYAEDADLQSQIEGYSVLDIDLLIGVVDAMLLLDDSAPIEEAASEEKFEKEQSL